MRKYLAVIECPPLGSHPASFCAENNKEADRLAFEISLQDPFVTGSYDLYEIVWDNIEWSHKLLKVEEGEK